MLSCYALHKAAIGTRCVSGERFERNLNTRLRPDSLTNPRGERYAHGETWFKFSDDCGMMRCYNVHAYHVG